MISKFAAEVATEMEKILESESYLDLFYHEKSAPTTVKLAAKKEEECNCPKNCACKQDGECKGACPCDKKRCKCPKGCDKCDCTEASGKCTCLKTENREDKKDDDKKKSDALQDLSYTLSKISADLDDAGYAKASVAVLHAHQGLLIEAANQPSQEDWLETQRLTGLSDEEMYMLVQDYGFELDENVPDAWHDAAGRGFAPEEPHEAPSAMPMPEADVVPHGGTRGILSEDPTQPEAGQTMNWEEIGAEMVLDDLEDIEDLIESGKLDEAEDYGDALFQVLEDDPTVPASAVPPTVEELAEEQGISVEELRTKQEEAAAAQGGEAEGTGTNKPNVYQSTAMQDVDAWLQKNAGAGAVHRIDDPRDPELSLDLDLKDLLTAKDGGETQLIDAYLAELDFEDE
jgi:hypothetical protein